MRSDLTKVVQMVRDGADVPALSLVRDDPQLAAMMSKLVTGRIKPMHDPRGNRKIDAPNLSEFQTTARRTMSAVEDSRLAMQLLPDLKLASQIVISAILSPKDMMTTELTFGAPENGLPAEINNLLNLETSKFFDEVYKIKDHLPKILYDVLFEVGSYTVAVLPESSVDEVINGQRRVSMEALSDQLDNDGNMQPMGLLGPSVPDTPTAVKKSTTFSLESFSDMPTRGGIDPYVNLKSLGNVPAVENHVVVTDNFNLLKVPTLNQRIREDRIMHAVGNNALRRAGVGLESSMKEKITEQGLASLIYKRPSTQYNPITMIKTQEQLSRRTVGNPLILHLPSEAVIPAYVPGCVEQQVGIFVLIDETGNPISKNNSPDYYNQLSNRLNSNSSFSSAMMQKVNQGMNGMACTNQQKMDYAARIYADIIEKDLLSRLQNGVYGNGVALAKREEVYRLMLSRQLQAQFTQLLFIPAELVTYYAVAYNDDGIGKSMLQEQNIVNAARALLLFANTMAAVKNSIPRTDVKIKLDEDDPDPLKTIERAQHEILRTKSMSYPMGSMNPTDIVTNLAMANMEFAFEGHPSLPDVSIEFGEKSSQYAKPDTELETDLRRRSIMGFGLTPELIDNAYQPEHATTVNQNNIMLSKRTMQMQEQFTPMIEDNCHKVAMNSQFLVEKLTRILTNNVERLRKAYEANMESDGNEVSKSLKDLPDEVIIQRELSHYLRNFTARLPKPDTVSLENHALAFDSFITMLDKALDAHFSADFLNSTTIGNVSEHIDTIKNVVRNKIIRDWFSKHGLMTEVTDIFAVNDEGQSVVNVEEMHADFIRAMSKAMGSFMNDITPSKLQSNKDEEARNNVDNTEVDNAPAPGSTGGSDSSGSDDGSDTPPEEDFGGGFDFDATPAGGDNPPEDTPPEETPPSE